MKKVSKILFVIISIIAFSSLEVCYAQQGDAFVLVDVSGSMRDVNTNREAKQIIAELLQGNFSLSNWQEKGWKNVNSAGSFFSSSKNAMLADGGKFCLMPFGNMLTVRKYRLTTVDNNSFSVFYNDAFPKSHTEANTYLTLAKAYSVVIASSEGLQGKKLWLVVYSDGMGDSMPSNNFPDDLQNAWDQFGATQASFSEKKGVLRKNTGGRNYDIEVWAMGPIPSQSVPDSPIPPLAKFKISSPQKGVSENTAIEQKKDVPLSISWSGNIGSVSMTVQIMKSGKPVKIDTPKDDYTKSVGANAAKITFHKAGTYKLILKDSRLNSDVRYVTVASPFPIMPILLLLLLVASGVFGYNKYVDSKKRKDVEGNLKPSSPGRPSPSNDTDWN